MALPVTRLGIPVTHEPPWDCLNYAYVIVLLKSDTRRQQFDTMSKIDDY